MTERVLVRVSDLRACKFCMAGSRDFFLRHDLDWRTFVREGIPAEELESTGDAMALKVAEVARGRK